MLQVETMLRWSVALVLGWFASSVASSPRAQTLGPGDQQARSDTTASAPATVPPPAPAPGAPYPPAPGLYPYPPGYYAPRGQFPPYPYPPPPGYYAPAAPSQPPPDPPAQATHLGVGYKIGNGLGFVGADLIVSPLPHLVLDLQANTASQNTGSGTATGYGVAPALQIHIREPGRSTPYLGLGYVYTQLSLANVKASGSGLFINAGYEWKWSSGMGIILGGGICYFGNIQASDGTTTITRDAELLPTLEAGIRFMFL